MKLHLQGYLDISSDSDLLLRVSKKPYSRYVDICSEVEEFFKDRVSVRTSGEDENEVKYITLDDACVRIFSSETYCSLAEAEEKLIEISVGEFEAYYETFAYSEFTILGFDLTTLKLGGHDLYDILSSMKDRYVHFLIGADEELDDLIESEEEGQEED